MITKFVSRSGAAASLVLRLLGRRIFMVPWIGALLIILSFQAQAAGLVFDGGFEQPVTGPGGPDSGYLDFAPGDTIGSAWKVVGSGPGDVAVFPSTETLFGSIAYNVPEGSQALDLTGDFDNGATLGVEQTVDTIPGAAYDLSFYVGSTSGQAAIVNVLINGVNVLTASNSDQTIGATNWRQVRYAFTAAKSATTIDLYNGSPAGVQTVGLDAVDLQTAAPEPSTLVIAGIGLLVLGRVGRRFAKGAGTVG
jgi:Protein of unknown function (DUF642)/PEP-CTERM motif